MPWLALRIRSIGGPNRASPGARDGTSPEIWTPGRHDYDEDETVSPLELMRWNEEEWGERLFVDGQPFDHPELGPVEIGGFRNDMDGGGPTPTEYVPYLGEQIRPCDCGQRAVAAGLTFRPLAETARSIIDEFLARGETWESKRRRFGLSREREAELLAAWRERVG